jgi:hypothetical protein
MTENLPNNASPTENVYLGIDLAGDSGVSGVVQVVETTNGLVYRLPTGPWTGQNGVKRMAQLAIQARQTAVDQPFGYAEATMKLLLDDPEAQCGLQATDYSSRHTDRAMRQILRGYGLLGDYVMSPNRCQNVWRALAFAKAAGFTRTEVCAGLGRVVETHPRVAWAVLLGRLLEERRLRDLIAGYKSTEDVVLAESSRHEMLAQLEAVSGIRADGDAESQRQCRASIVGSDDNLEGLVAAFVAYLCTKGKTVRALPAATVVNEATVALEGVAVLPAEEWSAP